ncbi:MAG: hypothetical protein FWB72_01350 [Firmicutes bacterium]|nr:hypothetical protein [Bacillota bacterium]
MRTQQANQKRFKKTVLLSLALVLALGALFTALLPTNRAYANPNLVTIRNSDFENTGSTFPSAPQPVNAWTQHAGGAAEGFPANHAGNRYGVIDTNVTRFRADTSSTANIGGVNRNTTFYEGYRLGMWENPLSPHLPANRDTNRRVLMLNNLTPSSYFFQSESVSLTAGSFYRISVWTQTRIRNYMYRWVDAYINIFDHNIFDGTNFIHNQSEWTTSPNAPILRTNSYNQLMPVYDPNMQASVYNQRHSHWHSLGAIDASSGYRHIYNLDGERAYTEFGTGTSLVRQYYAVRPDGYAFVYETRNHEGNPITTGRQDPGFRIGSENRLIIFERDLSGNFWNRNGNRIRTADAPLDRPVAVTGVVGAWTGTWNENINWWTLQRGARVQAQRKVYVIPNANLPEQQHLPQGYRYRDIDGQLYASNRRIPLSTQGGAMFTLNIANQYLPFGADASAFRANQFTNIDTQATNPNIVGNPPLFPQVTKTNDYVQLFYYVAASTVRNTPFNIRLGLGYGSALSPQTHAQGQAFFDDVRMERITAEQFSRAQTNVNHNTTRVLSLRASADGFAGVHNANAGDYLTLAGFDTRFTDNRPISNSQFSQSNTWETNATRPGVLNAGVISSTNQPNIIPSPNPVTANHTNLLAIATDNNNRVSFTSQTLELSAGYTFQLTFWARTIGLTEGISGFANIRHLHLGDNGHIDDDLTTDAGTHSINTNGEWTRFSFGLQASSRQNSLIQLELGLDHSAGTTTHQNIILFDYITLDVISTTNYNAIGMANNQNVSLQESVSPSFTNGFFDNITNNNPDRLWQPNGFTGPQAAHHNNQNLSNVHESIVRGGVVNRNIHDNWLPRTPHSHTPNLLMLENLAPTASGYVSDNVHVGANSFVQFSISLFTRNITGSGASVVLTHNGSPIAAFDNIGSSTSMNWTQFCFFIHTGSNSVDLRLEIWLGRGASFDILRHASGQIFVQSVRQENHGSFSASYDAYLNSVNRLAINFAEDNFSPVFASSDFEIFTDPLNWNASRPYNIVTSNSVTRGIVNTSRVPLIQVPNPNGSHLPPIMIPDPNVQSRNPNGFFNSGENIRPRVQGYSGAGALMLETERLTQTSHQLPSGAQAYNNATVYVYTSATPIHLSPNTHYVFEVWLQGRFQYGGASIALIGIDDAVIKNIGAPIAPATIGTTPTDPRTRNGFTPHHIFIFTGDNSYTAYIQIGLGFVRHQHDADNVYDICEFDTRGYCPRIVVNTASGVVYFDSVSFRQITQAEFELETSYAALALNNQNGITRIMIERELTEYEEEEETTRRGLDYWAMAFALPTLLIAAALLIAMLAVIYRRYFPKFGREVVIEQTYERVNNEEEFDRREKRRKEAIEPVHTLKSEYEDYED